MPKEVFFQVVINGSVCSADLETLRRWVREGKVGPGTVVTRDDGPPFPLRHLAELKDDLQSSIPTASGALRMPASPPPAASPASASIPGVSAPLVSSPLHSGSEFRSSEPKRGSEGPFPNERHRKDPRYIAAMKSIRRASWTGTILSVPVFLLGVLALTLPGVQLPATGLGIHPGVWVLALGGLLLLLSRGLHKGSRVCGALLFLWFGAGFFFNLFVLAHLLGSLVQGGLTFLFLCGLIGTFELRQFRREAERGNF
jgi:hypothetical protein